MPLQLPSDRIGMMQTTGMRRRVAAQCFMGEKTECSRNKDQLVMPHPLLCPSLGHTPGPWPVCVCTACADYQFSMSVDGGQFS